MTDDTTIPDAWIPLGDIEATSTNPHGGTYLDPRHGTLTIIRYHTDRENDVIRLYDHEVTLLTHRFIDYLTDHD